MKKKQFKNGLALNKKSISNLSSNSGINGNAVNGGQKPTAASVNGCEPHSVVHTCNYSDLRTCVTATESVIQCATVAYC